MQYLIGMLGEECNEIGKLCSKSQRFGLNSINPETNISNDEAICEEINDALAVIELLNKEFNLGFQINREKIDKKQKKMEKFLEYSISVGLVTTEPVNPSLYPAPKGIYNAF